MAQVFVPKESESDESRVAAIPETVKQLVGRGLKVAVETDAGLAAGFIDADYEAVGATIAKDQKSAMSSADMVLRIRPPKAGTDEVKGLKKGAVVVTGLQPLLEQPLCQALAKGKVTTFAMDLMPRITRAQKMDILSSQATVAGYQAVLMAAAELPKMFPLLMTAAGTIKPAKVVVLGAGVAGLQAIATAKRLGAVVEANDIRPAVREQVESLGGKFIDTGTPPQAETTGGYAKETSEEYARKQKEILTEHISGADVVITTALIPGRRAPVLVPDDMVKTMHSGAVIVDMAVAMGGNVEGSKAGETVVRHGVTILGETNLPARAANDASRMFARNINAFLEYVTTKEGAVEPQWDDEVVTATCVTHDGEIKHAATAEAVKSSGKS